MQVTPFKICTLLAAGSLWLPKDTLSLQVQSVRYINDLHLNHVSFIHYQKPLSLGYCKVLEQLIC